MAGAIKIREAASEDLPRILELLKGLEEDGAGLPLSDAQKPIERMALYPSHRLLTARLDGRIAGCFELLIMDNLAHMGEPSAVVEDVVVDPDLRSRGIDASMMRFAMDEARHAERASARTRTSVL